MSIDAKETRMILAQRVIYRARQSQSPPRSKADNPKELKYVWGSTTLTTYLRL